MKLTIALLFIFLVSQLNAEPIVIFDSGKTMPSFAYKQILQDVDVQVPDFGKNWTFDKLENNKDNTNFNDPKKWLPIVSKKLKPGKVKSREVRFNQLLSPVCIIGSDKRSLQWIKKHKKILKENNVLCWLVQAENTNDVKTVVDVLDGIPMTPADGDAIATFFSIRYYPLLITARFIEQ